MPSSPPSTSIQPTLKKGLACLPCRKKKIRCDGGRPSCGQCNRSTRTHSVCEYADTAVQAIRASVLEGELNALQNRIEELEKAEYVDNPYIVSSKLPSDLFNTENVPPPNDLALFVRAFFSEGREYGLFIDEKRMERGGDLALSYCPIVRNAIFLWSVHLVSKRGNKSYVQAEKLFLSRALAYLAVGLHNCMVNEVVYLIQGMVLLSTYLFDCGRVFEAKNHLSAACSMCYSAGLHRLGTSLSSPGASQSQPFPTPYPGSATFQLLPAEHEYEARERICGFWTVMNLNTTWTSADDSPSYFDYLSRSSPVTTPFPDYTGQSQGEETVLNFMARLPDQCYGWDAMLAKGGLLMSKASYLSQQYRPGMSSFESTTLFNEFMVIDDLIDSFTADVNAIQYDIKTAARAILVRSLAVGATLKLHQRYSPFSPPSMAKILNASKAMADIIEDVNLKEVTYLNPVLGGLWSTACTILLGQLQAMSTAPLEHQKALSSPIKTLFGALSHAAENCSLIESQHAALKGHYSSAMENYLV